MKKITEILVERCQIYWAISVLEFDKISRHYLFFWGGAAVDAILILHRTLITAAVRRF